MSSHKGTCFDAEYPAALEMKPTNAVTEKCKPVKVVAVIKKQRVNIDELVKENPKGV